MIKIFFQLGLVSILVSCTSDSTKNEQSNNQNKKSQAQVSDSRPIKTGKLSDSKKIDSNNEDSKGQVNSKEIYIVPNKRVTPEELEALKNKNGNSLLIELEKEKSGEWFLSYRLKFPVKSLGFSRNPDDSRTKRWISLSEKIELVYKNGKEIIVASNDSDFTEAKFKLTANYAALPKDYAPFSPFSDGGLLLHSGRFFACIDSCAEEDNLWNISLKTETQDQIIINGRIYREAVQWQDRDNGQNIYVGKLNPIENSHAIAIVDPGLPESIRSSLQSDIPKMMDYFSSRLGQLPSSQKPSLFASYAKIQDGHTQGGTLPGQIFMHWNSNSLEKHAKNQKFIVDTLWFFAHEVAHLFQSSKNGQLDHEPNQSWIHEGNAEFLALSYIEENYPDAKNYIENRLKQKKSSCLKGLRETSLNKAADKGKFALYYSCGVLIHKAIDEAISFRSKKRNIFYLWRTYRSKVGSGEKAGEELFLEIVDDLTDFDFRKKLERALKTQSVDALKDLN